MQTLRDIQGIIVQAADVLAWNLVMTMLGKSFDPILEDADNWLGHVEDYVVNQLEVDGSALLVNWKLIESLVNNVAKVTQTRIANELQEPMLVLTASPIRLVKLEEDLVINQGGQIGFVVG
jgi:hypothetical protein